MTDPNRRLFLAQALLDRKLSDTEGGTLTLALGVTGAVRHVGIVINLWESPFPGITTPAKTSRGFITVLVEAEDAEAVMTLITQTVQEVADTPIAYIVHSVVSEVARRDRRQNR